MDSDRTNMIQSISKSNNLDIRIMWFTVSKAFLRSSEVTVCHLSWIVCSEAKLHWVQSKWTGIQIICDLHSHRFLCRDYRLNINRSVFTSRIRISAFEYRDNNRWLPSTCEHPLRKADNFGDRNNYSYSLSSLNITTSIHILIYIPKYPLLWMV